MTNLLVLLWTGGNWLWKNCPSWITVPILITVGPNLIVNVTIFYFFLVPFFTQQWHTIAKPFREARDNQIKELVLTNNFQYQTLTHRLDKIDQHQSLMMAELLRRSQP